MDFITQRESLLAELNLFSGVVETKPTDPMSEFANVSFVSDGDGCELKASSGEIGLRSRIAANVRGEGQLNAPVGLLVAWLREGSHESVSFTHTGEGNWVRIKCGENKTRIPVRVGDPPDLPAPGSDPECEVGSDLLATLIETGAYAMPSVADAAATTVGAQIEVKSPYVRIVSSDHSRLAWASANLSGGPPEGIPGASPDEDGIEKRAFGLNRKTLSQLSQLARTPGQDGQAPPMKLYEGGNHLFFEFGDRILVSTKLAGRLPEYDHVIPQSCAVHVRVRRQVFLASVLAAMPFATGEFHRAKIDIDHDAMHINVLSVRGEATGSVHVNRSGGTPLAIHVNLVHLRDFAKVGDSEEVTLQCDSPDSAFLLTPVEEAESSFRNLCVGMPLLAPA